MILESRFSWHPCRSRTSFFHDIALGHHADDFVLVIDNDNGAVILSLIASKASNTLASAGKVRARGLLLYSARSLISIPERLGFCVGMVIPLSFRFL
jgi:hypothetical protein